MKQWTVSWMERGESRAAGRPARQRVFVMAAVGLMLLLAACNLNQPDSVESLQQPTQPTVSPSAVPSTTPTETEPPYTPLASFTPSRTLRPAPTFAPPTLTRPPTQPPSATPEPTLDTTINIPGLREADTPVPTGAVVCEKRDDWVLEYTVQFGDTLSTIAGTYGTFPGDLATGNCLDNADVIREGQVLRVPGAAHPVRPAIECIPWELITPLNGTISVPGDGVLTFNWRGPNAPRNLLRIYRANAQGVPQTAENAPLLEVMIEYRQNEVIALADLPEAGTYAWRIFPLTWEFQPTGCEASPSAQFTKAAAPAPTPTLSLGP